MDEKHPQPTNDAGSRATPTPTPHQPGPKGELPAGSPPTLVVLAALGVLGLVGAGVAWRLGWGTKASIAAAGAGLVALWGFGHLRTNPARAWAAHRFMMRLGPAGLLGLAWASLPAIGGALLLYFIDDVSALLERDPTLGLAGYVAVFVLAAGLGLLPTYAQALLGGWVFGLGLGFAGAEAGFVGASLVGYAVGRFAAKDRVERVIAEHPRWEAVRNALVGQGFFKTLGIVTLVRIPPNSPFALTNLVLCSTGVGILPYALGTALGMAPRTLLAVWLASAAKGAAGDGGIRGVIDGQPWWVFVVTIAAAMVVLGVIGAIGNAALERVTGGARGGAAGATGPKPDDAMANDQ